MAYKMARFRVKYWDCVGIVKGNGGCNWGCKSRYDSCKDWENGFSDSYGGLWISLDVI